MRENELVAIQVEATIAEYAAMVGWSYSQARNLAYNGRLGGYKQILEAIHRGAPQ